jgi:hypothetical protein
MKRICMLRGLLLEELAVSAFGDDPITSSLDVGH